MMPRILRVLVIGLALVLVADAVYGYVTYIEDPYVVSLTNVNL